MKFVLPDDPPIAPSLLAPGIDPTWSLADLQEHLGGILFERICLYPSPGRVTEQDLLEMLDRKKCLTELIDGVLVNKALGQFESRLAAIIGYLLELFSAPRMLGPVYGPDCPVRLFPGQIREPDVSFVSWSRFPGRKIPAGQVLGMAPDLAVEVISPTNTNREMERKVADYFRAGTRRVWYVYPWQAMVRVFHSPTEHEDLTGEQILDGADVLLGFEVSVKTIFELASDSR